MTVVNVSHAYKQQTHSVVDSIALFERLWECVFQSDCGQLCMLETLMKDGTFTPWWRKTEVPPDHAEPEEHNTTPLSEIIREVLRLFPSHYTLLFLLFFSLSAPNALSLTPSPNFPSSQTSLSLSFIFPSWRTSPALLQFFSSFHFTSSNSNPWPNQQKQLISVWPWQP